MVKGPWAGQGLHIVFGIINTLVRAFIWLVGPTKATTGIHLTKNKFLNPFVLKYFISPLHLSSFSMHCHLINSFHFVNKLLHTHGLKTAVCTFVGKFIFFNICLNCHNVVTVLFDTDNLREKFVSLLSPCAPSQWINNFPEMVSS